MMRPYTLTGGISQPFTTGLSIPIVVVIVLTAVVIAVIAVFIVLRRRRSFPLKKQVQNPTSQPIRFW